MVMLCVSVHVFIQPHPPQSFQDQKSLIHYISEEKKNLSFKGQSINSIHSLKQMVKKKWH